MQKLSMVRPVELSRSRCHGHTKFSTFLQVSYAGTLPEMNRILGRTCLHSDYSYEYLCLYRYVVTTGRTKYLRYRSRYSVHVARKI